MPSSTPSNMVPCTPAQFSPSANHSTSNNFNATLGYFGMAIFIAIVLYIIIRLILAALPNQYHERQLAMDNLAQQPKVGLDLHEISLLPMFMYRACNKDLSVECAVCISELVEGEMVRVLPNCKHFFHVKCIDMWLCNNSSCPLCRGHPEPEKMKLDLLSASPPLPQLAQCGTMSQRMEFGFGSCLGSPSMKSARRGGSERLGSIRLSTLTSDLHEIRVDMSFGRHTLS